MSDDKLLNALAAAARKDRARHRLDPRWDRYAANELTETEIEQLLADSRAKGEPDVAQDAFRPLDDDFRARLANEARSRLNVQDAEPRTANTVELRIPKKRYIAPLALAASLIAAVGITLVVLPSKDFAPLPAYTAALHGGSDYRSGTPQVETPVFHDGDRLELRLTPATAVEGNLNGLIVLSDSQSTTLAQPDRGLIDIAPSGAARVVATIGTDLSRVPGVYRLFVAIGREAALPTPAALQKALASDQTITGPGWQGWRYDIQIDP